MKLLLTSGITLFALVILATPAWPDRFEELEKKLQLMREQQEKFLAEQQKLLQEIERLKAEQDRLRKEQAKRTLSERELKKVFAGQAPRQEAPPKAEQQAQPEEPPQLTLERTLIERGGLLLQPGQLEFNPSFEYSFFSTRRISVAGFSILPTLIIGVLETERVQRSILDPSLTLRLGIFKDFQGEFKVPYRLVYDRRSTETTETKDSTNGIGDIEGGFFYQPLKERGWIPDLILGLQGKTRTGEDPFGGTANKLPIGTGFASITGQITAVKSSDPAALFASFLYTHNFSREVRLLATDTFKTNIFPGDSVGYVVGIGLGLNNELAINFRFDQRFVFQTETESPATGFQLRRVRGSNLNVGTAFFGLTWALTRSVSADFSVGRGMTEDSPNIVVKVGFPFRFNLF